MSELTRKHRLNKVHRVNALKERRAERARIKAVRAEREARDKSEAAAAARKEAAARLTKARSSFFDVGGSAEAEIWMIAEGMREKQAAESATRAETNLSGAQDDTRLARCKHEQIRERGVIIDQHLAAVERVITIRAQNRDDEEMQERIR